MDENAIRQETTHSLCLVLSEFNLQNFFDLSLVNQAYFYNSIRFSIKADFNIGEKEKRPCGCDCLGNPLAQCDFHP